ncbi:hypothetical protein, partial [uncultured Helicobacter sp.]|uniref:hypothetical protein n=1 Tax=uncultured Helicobacter sp. TaxID=175537 RepID=UPI00262954F4
SRSISSLLALGFEAFAFFDDFFAFVFGSFVGIASSMDAVSFGEDLGISSSGKDRACFSVTTLFSIDMVLVVLIVNAFESRLSVVSSSAKRGSVL